MKIAYLLGRGIEGCGVTRCAIEMAKASPGSKIFAITDKRWPREASMDFQWSAFKAAKWENCQAFLDEVVRDGYDVVYVFSVPSTDHPTECQENFIKILDTLTIPKVMFQLDHKIQSINRNARYAEVCARMKVLLTYSKDNDFGQWSRKNGVTTPLVEITNGFKFDEQRAKYWVPINEQDDFTYRWIGRTAGWKGFDLAIQLHSVALKAAGFKTIIEGLEANIGWAGVVYADPKNKTGRYDVVNKFRCEKELGETKEFTYGAETAGQGAYLYPPYNNHDCMQRLARSAFGSNLYHLNERFYGRNLENAHAEVIAVGTVPVFHRHFGTHIVHRVTGNPVIQDTDNGTIFVDETNMNEVGELMAKLAKDPILRDEWRERSFAYWKQHLDLPIVAQEVHEIVTHAIKQ